MGNNKRIFPGALTTANMFFGFLAIIKTISGDIATAGWLIIIAAIMDGLDGKLARRLNQGSRFGKEYDSMADMVSFGVAPALLAYTAYFQRFEFLGLVIVFIYLFMGGYRLARYNAASKPKVKDKFIGLPIPMAAITIVSFIQFNTHHWNEPVLYPLFHPLIGALCFLMVSHIQYDAIPRLTLREGAENRIKLGILIGALILAAILPETLFFPLCIFYIVQGIVRSIIRSARKLEPEQEQLESASR